MENIDLKLDGFFEKHPSLKKEILAPLLSQIKKEQVLAKANRQMRRACQEALLMQSTGG